MPGKNRKHQLTAALFALLWHCFACASESTSGSGEQTTMDMRLRQGANLQHNPLRNTPPNANVSSAFPRDKLIRDSVVSVSINGFEVLPSVPVVEVPGLGFAIAKQEYDTLGLNSAKPWMAVRGEDEYVVLNRIPGLELQYNSKTLALGMRASPELLSKTNVRVYTESGIQVRTPPNGAYLNYDLTANKHGADSQSTASFEAVAFSRFGSLVSNHLFSKSQGNQNNSPPSSLRLSTYFQHDRPDNMHRFRVGDSLSNSGAWGRGVNYAGLKFGTDFSLNPTLVTLPTLQASGSASVPSVVELFVNGALQRRLNVPAGTFVLDQIPAVTGNGNARIVVRDPQGREQVIEQPFYRAPLQLRPGLSDYALDIGKLRQNFGLASNDYGDGFAAAGIRTGVNNALTVEGRGEVAQNGLRNLGMGAVFAIGAGHSLAPSVQWSDSTAGRGLGYQLGYSFTGSALRLAARLERYSSDYRQLGFAANELPVEQRLYLSAGLRLGSFTDLGVFLSENTPRNSDKVRIGSLTLSHRFTRDWLVSATVSRNLIYTLAGANTSKSTTGSLNVTWIPDSLSVASINASHDQSNQNTPTTASLRYSQRPQIEGGIGVDLEIGSTGNARARAEYLGNSGVISAEVARLRSDPTAATRVHAQGAVVAIGGSAMTSRRVDESFVLVKAPDAPNQSVTRGGRAYKLNANGEAVIERVQPYQSTRVAVAAANLPLELEIGKAEERFAVPAKAGIVLDMQVQRKLPASFNLQYLNKAPTAGSKILLEGKEFVIGLDGLVYIPDLGVFGKQAKALRGTYTVTTSGPNAGKSCTFTLPLPVGELIQDFGNVMCQ